jgi:hypothetical protein
MTSSRAVASRADFRWSQVGALPRFLRASVLAGFSLSSTQAPAPKESVNDAVDTYLYGFPLVTMDMTRKQTTNVDSAGPERAPMGQLVRMRTFPTAAYRDVPGANTDTLYTMVWLDVSKEPWIFSIPDMGDRYYMMPMLDGWTNLFAGAPSETAIRTPAQGFRIEDSGFIKSIPRVPLTDGICRLTEFQPRLPVGNDVLRPRLPRTPLRKCAVEQRAP